MNCIYDSDKYFCGSFCIYGDCFEPVCERSQVDEDPGLQNRVTQ